MLRGISDCKMGGILVGRGTHHTKQLQTYIHQDAGYRKERRNLFIGEWCTSEKSSRKAQTITFSAQMTGGFFCLFLKDTEVTATECNTKSVHGIPQKWKGNEVHKLYITSDIQVLSNDIGSW
jgi:hypothetical protein